MVVERGLRIGAAAADDFRSLLAVGLALVIGVQAFIIAAGNLKVLPLTGITLPFISYGGSSLLANALVIGLLLALSDKGVEPPPLPRRRRIALAPARPPAERRLMLGHGTARRPLGRTTIHVAIVRLARLRRCSPVRPATGGSSRRPTSSRSPDDAAVIAAARTVPRGQILDRDGTVLADNKTDANGEPYRVYAGRTDQPGRRLRVATVRAAGPRARLRRRADRPRRRRPGQRRCSPSSAPTGTTPRT